MAEALKLAQKGKEKESKRLTALRDYFIKQLSSKIDKITINGDRSQRLPNNINISVLGVEGESLVLYLDEYGVAASTGSACSSMSLEPSHVITAISSNPLCAHGSLRFTLGKSNTKKDLDYVLKVLPEIVKKLRSISPIKI
jgi:cysteine desulfurase